jgi:predicted ABC-type ATPase
MSPTLTLVAGPNGSGKSTISAALADEAIVVIDPDAIARTIDSRQPSRAAIPAARRAVLLCRALLAKRDSFLVESTLAGHGAIALLAGAKRAGYRVVVIYVALGDPDLQIDRVRLRVAQGGHDIPDADIRRRYFRSLFRAPAAIGLADEAIVLDNAGPQPERMLLVQGGRVVWQAGILPTWVHELLLRMDGVDGKGAQRR